MDSMIPQELVDFLSSGISAVIGTRDASLMPECTRAWGVRVEPDREFVTLFITESISLKTLENLRDNGQIAISCSGPANHQACQLKGVYQRARSTTPEDEAFWRNWLEKFKATIATVGAPTEVFGILHSEPVVAIEVRITDAFSQTPGPQAGARI